MLDWTTFLTGGAAGSVLGVVLSGLTSNVAHELLEEWREDRASKREQQQEVRAELRQIREAKRSALLPALNQVFMATDTIMREAEQLLLENERMARARDDLSHREDGLCSPDLARAMEQVSEALLVIRREMEAHELVTEAMMLREFHDELDTELGVPVPNMRVWPMRRTFVQTMLEHLQEQAEVLQDTVLAAKAELEHPL